ncbi:MAG: hypothetical protein JKY67_17185 [Pseudomonadales bacterium]|nr:hypothetical protein [Pseudomonadales bacterium]
MTYGFAKVTANVEESGGSVDYLYDQSLDIRSKSGGGSVSKGWCHAATIMWIKKNFAGVDFLEWFGPAEKACPQRRGQGATVGDTFSQLKNIMLEQESVLNAGKNHAHKGWWAVDYALVSSVVRYNMTPGPDGIISFQINKSATQMVEMLSTAVGYNYCRLSGAKGAHAIGVYVSPDGASIFSYFDPNFGQFHFPNRDAFISFLKKLMPASGYGRAFDRFGIINITAST